MGGSLSALLLELYFIDYKTNNIFSIKPYSQFNKDYLKYVDVNFILFKDTNLQAEITVNSLNKINKHFQFTP